MRRRRQTREYQHAVRLFAVELPPGFVCDCGRREVAAPVHREFAFDGNFFAFCSHRMLTIQSRTALLLLGSLDHSLAPPFLPRREFIALAFEGIVAGFER